MMSRTTQTSLTGRASAIRRLRRRAAAASTHLYCATNGCASYLLPDPDSGVARCPICGYVRRTN